MIYHGAVISDIHFGAVPAKSLKRQLTRVFLKHISAMERLDLVVIAGDLFDRKLSLNDEHSRVALEFMNALVRVARKKKAKIRIVRGTRNHDLNQLNNFRYLERSALVDFRIFETAAEEETLPGMRVLYIPEEYVEDPGGHYGELLSGRYGMCFGHGTFQHVGFGGASQESERPMRNAPVFNYEDFRKAVTGAVIFGHVHTASEYKKKIYYCGSFTRWAFGEEEPKGFRTFSFDTETGKCEVGFVENPLAPRYVTVNATEILASPKLTVEQKAERIERLKRKAKADFLRVKADLPQRDDGQIEILRAHFSGKGDGVRLSLDGGPRGREDEEASELEERFSYIFKGDLPIEKRISLFLRDYRNIQISDARVASVLREEPGKGGE